METVTMFKIHTHESSATKKAYEVSHQINNL